MWILTLLLVLALPIGAEAQIKQTIFYGFDWGLSGNPSGQNGELPEADDDSTVITPGRTSGYAMRINPKNGNGTTLSTAGQWAGIGWKNCTPNYLGHFPCNTGSAPLQQGRRSNTASSIGTEQWTEAVRFTDSPLPPELAPFEYVGPRSNCISLASCPPGIGVSFGGDRFELLIDSLSKGACMGGASVQCLKARLKAWISSDTVTPLAATSGTVATTNAVLRADSTHWTSIKWRITEDCATAFPTACTERVQITFADDTDNLLDSTIDATYTYTLGLTGAYGLPPTVHWLLWDPIDTTAWDGFDVDDIAGRLDDTNANPDQIVPVSEYFTGSLTNGLTEGSCTTTSTVHCAMQSEAVEGSRTQFSCNPVLSCITVADRLGAISRIPPDQGNNYLFGQGTVGNVYVPAADDLTRLLYPAAGQSLLAVEAHGWIAGPADHRIVLSDNGTRCTGEAKTGVPTAGTQAATQLYKSQVSAVCGSPTTTFDMNWLTNRMTLAYEQDNGSPTVKSILNDVAFVPIFSSRQLPSATGTNTPTHTPTITLTPVVSFTPTETPTVTPTVPTRTPTKTGTFTVTPLASDTPTRTRTPTWTPTQTLVPTSADTHTPAPTFGPTAPRIQYVQEQEQCYEGPCSWCVKNQTDPRTLFAEVAVSGCTAALVTWDRDATGASVSSGTPAPLDALIDGIAIPDHTRLRCLANRRLLFSGNTGLHAATSPATDITVEGCILDGSALGVDGVVVDFPDTSNLLITDNVVLGGAGIGIRIGGGSATNYTVSGNTVRAAYSLVDLAGGTSGRAFNNDLGAKTPTRTPTP